MGVLPPFEWGQWKTAFASLKSSGRCKAWFDSRPGGHAPVRGVSSTREKLPVTRSMARGFRAIYADRGKDPTIHEFQVTPGVGYDCGETLYRGPIASDGPGEGT